MFLTNKKQNEWKITMTSNQFKRNWEICIESKIKEKRSLKGFL